MLQRESLNLLNLFIKSFTFVWFDYIGRDSCVTASTAGSSIDTILAVYEGGCRNLECITVNDGSAAQLYSDGEISLLAKSGIRYNFLVANAPEETGGEYAFNLRVRSNHRPHLFSVRTPSHLLQSFRRYQVNATIIASSVFTIQSSERVFVQVALKSRSTLFGTLVHRGPVRIFSFSDRDFRILRRLSRRLARSHYCGPGEFLSLLFFHPSSIKFQTRMGCRI